MTYDAGHPCCAEYGRLKQRIKRLREVLVEIQEMTPSIYAREHMIIRAALEEKDD